MQFGVCCGCDIAPQVKAAGFDYFESSVGNLLCPEASDEEFDKRRAAHAAAGLPCPVLNVFLPGDLRLTGPETDPARQMRYLDTAFARAEKAGVDTIVFGSGGARRIPDDFPRETAWEQLVAFAREVGDRAAAHNVMVAMEPLNRRECNILTSLAETLTFVAEVDHPAVRALVDAFHWAREREAMETIARADGQLVHTHIATEVNRQAPSLEPCDFSGFYRGLALAGYDRRMSVEGGLPESLDTLPQVLDAMRQGLAEAKKA